VRKPFFVLILLAVYLVSSFLAFAVYSNMQIELVKTFSMDINVVEAGVIGFNIDADAVHFGRVMSGGSSTKMINLTGSNRTRYVRAYAYGSLGEWVGFSENPVILGNNSYRELYVSAVVPDSAAYGSYNGTIKLVFMKK